MNSAEGAHSMELVVYAMVSPSQGLTYPVYSEEDIQSLGGIHAIERILEKDSYWFVRLGIIFGEADPRGITYADTEFSKLVIPPHQDTWQIGKRNPGYRGSELERIVFKAIYGCVERFLQSWNWECSGLVYAYALKELRIHAQCLILLSNCLKSMRQAHEVVHVTVTKYWYGSDWPEPHEADLALAELSFDIPFRVQWAGGEEIIDVQVLRPSLC